MAIPILVSCAACAAPFKRGVGRSPYCSDSCRFWSKVDKSAGADGCWPWIGSRDGCGYGMFTSEGKSERAHRHAYRLAVGAIPAGLLACHKCDNPGCCNPAHLFIGTAGDNNTDRARKGRTNYAAAVEVMRQKKIGKRPPESTLEAARLANTGKKRPPEVVEKVRQAILGTKRSDETKAKLRAAWARRKAKAEMQAGRM